ncbi:MULTISPECIES: restriction endonuclease subunit S [Veillonella]|uniref:restriction endonuclease subunit S n=1 Tax=Veillonella TaxID=29465 RepID=UPI0014522BF0|nr:MULTISPECIES: restriction endonuclease subunit S [Veillonella]MBS6862719.1 restriction endonuclease subunit S [Veillonella sp.]MDU3886249.1 restriction endonuclease subunit S [Veillonella sp.]CAB1275302.1 hypothetical protein FNLLGLLA_00772 [Veillonella parvula]
MANKPRIRFRGFTEDWEQRKLGDLYKRVNERNDGTLGRDKWISVAKMYFQDPDKVQSNNLDTRTYVMKKGDIAFEGHPNNEFKFGRFVLNDIGTGIISELFPIYRPITEYDLDFWKYAIQLERVMAPILAKSITSSGNSSNKLDHNHFLNKELLVPNIEEQKKIGTLLSLLSKNITLHQCKLKKLNLAKKSLLQKLFPRNGSQIPGVRFKGFTDAWEQRKLGDIATFSKGNGYSKSDLAPSGDPIILYGRLYTNYETTIRNVDTFVELKDKSVISQGDEVIVPASGETVEDISRASVVKDQGVIIGGDLNVIKVNHLLDPTFLALTISNGEQQKELSKRAQGKSVVHLHNSDLQEVNLTFPLLNEQKEISTLFEKMDSIITLHQRKLERLQEVKKGLLQKMFV